MVYGPVFIAALVYAVTYLFLDEEEENIEEINEDFDDDGLFEEEHDSQGGEEEKCTIGRIPIGPQYVSESHQGHELDDHYIFPLKEGRRDTNEPEKMVGKDYTEAEIAVGNESIEKR